ncbi:DgyrCDS3804 [Dimorphilus gyrociliatus]|nr:DgyrCDS3804 [Dimorphilus gyrociliatus]
MLYDNMNSNYDSVEATSEVLGLGTNAVWEMFGEMFFDFCEESGYDRILSVLGGTLRDFLQNLDALHDHLATIYPGMRPPSFRCSEKRPDGSMILHYYSERKGLEHVVIGMVKAIAQRLHSKEVTVEIVSTTWEFCRDHVQFLIRERVAQNPALVRYDHSVELLSETPLISPATFCKAFPFHVIMNRELNIVQVGQSLSRVVPELNQPNCSFKDVFQIVRPHLVDTTYEQIINHADNTTFVVRVRDKRSQSPRQSIDVPSFAFLRQQARLGIPDAGCRTRMRLKGQMVELPDRLLFLSSPNFANIDELLERGLYLSDIPIHDATRDLILLSEQFRAEYELTQKLEVLNDKMQQTYKELEIEKQLTDKLVYSILPPTVANRLRLGEPVEAKKYSSASILFSGIYDFNSFCNSNTPIKVVNLLNELYTKFDSLAEPQIYDVYKVETVGDKYMLASGLPERSGRHAKNIALVALDMMDIVRELQVDGQNIRLTIGIHSGEVVAGVVGQKLPRYAVFGSTVCLASRMESTGLTDCINISETTFECLQTEENRDEQFEIKKRGLVPMKGRKEPMACYILSRNLRNLPKVQMMLESGIPVQSSRPPSGTATSPLSLSDQLTANTLRQVALNLQDYI